MPHSMHKYGFSTPADYSSAWLANRFTRLVINWTTGGWSGLPCMPTSTTNMNPVGICNYRNGISYLMQRSRPLLGLGDHTVLSWELQMVILSTECVCNITVSSSWVFHIARLDTQQDMQSCINIHELIFLSFTLLFMYLQIHVNISLVYMYSFFFGWLYIKL